MTLTLRAWRIAAPIFLVLFLAMPGYAQPSLTAFKNRAAAGPYAVGLRVVEQYDRSRTFQPSPDEQSLASPGGRPMQTLIWYPADKTATAPMTYGDYVKLLETEISLRRPAEVKAPTRRLLALLAPSLSEQMTAVRDAAAMRGRFPVVIYAPSFTSPAWENAELCEYLASFGYLVLSSPGMGVSRTSTHDLAGIEAQAKDISFLIDHAATLANADISNVAVAGFSWGGLSNVFAAAHDARIKALVGLDGSIRYWPGLVKAGGIDPARIAVPLLFFKSQSTIEGQAGLEANFKDAAGPSVINAWTAGDRFSVEMLRMVHPEFGTIVYRNQRFWTGEFNELQPGDYSREDGIESYSWVATYTRQFLDYYLKKNPEAMQFLQAQPTAMGVPQHYLTIRFRPGTGRP
jgi:pimeloyl-ACP methyl ester carboxylesterase